MKRKFFSILFALVLVLSLGLVMAVPVSANVSSATVTVSPTTISLSAQYTIAFTTTQDLAQSANDDIRIEFPSDTTVPAASSIEGNVTINGNTVTDATVVSRLVTLKVPVDVPTGSVTVVFATAAGIVNPSTAATTYTVDVFTSREVTPITSGTYDITPLPPTVTGVSPATGVQGASLTVTITGTNFLTATAASFGSGITVGTPTVVSDTQITVSIDIAAGATLGYRDVSVTTPSGTGILTDGFEVVAPPPTVTSVAPPEANQGETLDVVITGTNLSGATAVSFGPLISVTFTVDSATKITASITIDSTAITGLRSVSVTTAAGTDDEPDVFMVGIAGTALVDIYDASGVYKSSEASITLAIADTDAVTGGTLIAHAADYDSTVETFPITVSRALTIKSYMGAASTTIDASASDAEAAVEITTTGTVLGGEGAGFTIIAEDRDSANPGINHKGIHLTNAVDDVTIEGNVITGGALSPQLGILIGTFGETETYSNIQILNNAFNTTWDVAPGETNPTCGGIKSWTTATLGGTLLIDKNTITGFSVGMNLEGDTTGTSETAPAIISNNTVYGNDYNGISVDQGTWVEVSSNQAYNNGGNGIAIVFAPGKNKVFRNDVYGNGNGVKVYSGCTASEVLVQYNDIYDNTNTTVTTSSAGTPLTYDNYGVLNAGTGDLNAKYNWWGDETGPSHDLNLGGQGNAVSDNVDFSPWLYETQENFVSDAPCYAGSVPITNEATLVDTTSYAGGWNSFSTPITLDGSANSVSELLALTAGSDLSIVRAQRFDLASQEWVAVVMGGSLVEDYQIQPGEGFFIQVSTGGSLPILCETSPTSPPSRDLVAGQNLIGLSSLGAESVGTALSGVTYSVVLSPSPPNATSWSVPPDGVSKELLLGEAYWVAMGAPGFLFGFTYTPVADTMTWELNQ